jgi:hypothetical protein
MYEFKGNSTLPHLTPGLVRLAVVVWGVMCVGMCACRYMCVHVCVRAHLVPALYGDPTGLRADNCIYIQRKYISFKTVETQDWPKFPWTYSEKKITVLKDSNLWRIIAFVQKVRVQQTKDGKQ